MRQIFDAELTQLGDDLIKLSALVGAAITGAGIALLQADVDAAQEVIQGDDEIDVISRGVDERAVLVLAQQSPVATDLRAVVSALRMSQTLERMGDLAAHIASIARRTYPAYAIPESNRPVFASLDRQAVALSGRLTNLLQTRDIFDAAAIERDDDAIDELRNDSYASLTSPSWAGSVQDVVNVTLAGRYYERFGDHGVSIARRVIYLVTGTTLTSED